MPEKFTVFDVETPNRFNNRISAIGISVIENGKITNEYYSLVNPETDFDYFNIALTGITPEAVLYEPCFSEIWEKIQPLFENSVLVAHNAVFDLSVLSKCFESYCIDWHETVKYLCTCRTGRKVYPNLENHRLNTMSEYLGIPLDHHNAGSDCTACAKLLLNYTERGFDINSAIKTYDIYNRKTI